MKNVNLDDKIAKEISHILKKKEELATKYDLQFMKTELIKWVAGMLIAQAAIVATLVKYL